MFSMPNLLAVIVGCSVFGTIVGCPYLRRTSENLLDQTSFPAVCNSKNVISRENLTCDILNQINESFYSVLPDDLISRTNLIAISVRVAFHDAAEFNINTTDLLGPDGCLSSDPDNAGMIEDTSLVMTTLESIWQNYCDRISRADFWVYIAGISINLASGYKVSIPFQYGRSDATECQNDGTGRLPSGQFFYNDTENFFLNQLNLNIEDGITLIGAHTVGHVHPNVSGHGQKCSNAANNDCNAWDNTPNVFDNLFYVNLINAIWANKGGSYPYNIWQAGPNILMNSDVTLGFNMDQSNGTYGTIGQQCGGTFKKGDPTVSNGYDCANPSADSKSAGYDLVKTYAQDNSVFLEKFAHSFVKLTTVGYDYNSNQFVKYGALSNIQCTV